MTIIKHTTEEYKREGLGHDGVTPGIFQTTYAAYKFQYIFCNPDIFVACIFIYRVINSYYIQAYFKINLLHITSIYLFGYKVGNFADPSG